ncbi:MAG: hypothetical protein C0469_11220 [Cyanobacteria bacterium DS2.3.42]|nr:hypothetical protein [Cyanobacteria bacterium DS2.3.42]
MPITAFASANALRAPGPMNTVPATTSERKILFATPRSEMDDTTARPLKNRDSVYEFGIEYAVTCQPEVGPLRADSAYQEWILIESIYIDTGFLLIS